MTSAIPKVKDRSAHQFEPCPAGDGYVVLDGTSGHEVTSVRSFERAVQDASALNNAIAHSRAALGRALGALEDDEEPSYFDVEVHAYA